MQQRLQTPNLHASVSFYKQKALHIHVPEDWYKLVRSLDRQNISFEVIEMTTEDFYDFEKLFANSFVKRKSNEDKVKFLWPKVR